MVAAGLLLAGLALIASGLVWFTRSDAAPTSRADSSPPSTVRAAKLLVTQPDLGENPH